jgi:hypothetical protein
MQQLEALQTHFQQAAQLLGFSLKARVAGHDRDAPVPALLQTSGKTRKIPISRHNLVKNRIAPTCGWLTRCNNLSTIGFCVAHLARCRRGDI